MRDGRESLVVGVLVLGLVVGLLSSVFGLLDEDGGGGEDEDGLSLGWDMLDSTSPGWICSLAVWLSALWLSACLALACILSYRLGGSWPAYIRL